MSIVIIGAGGVGSVVAHKCAQLSDVFGEIVLASRTLSKCVSIADSVLERTGVQIQVAQVDADIVEEVETLFNKYQPYMVINVALPYQDLTIMDACLSCGVHYLDTANYEPRDEAKFEYHWQWAYQERFKEAGLTAILGSGFDPGVTSVFTAYALKHEFDVIKTLDIIDVNAGDHGQAFATNFNPEINIREVSAECKHWESGEFVTTPPMSLSKAFNCPEDIGEFQVYRMYHEELESLTKNIPTIEKAQFWMSFSPEYLKHLEVLKNVGMTGIQPVKYQGVDIVPLQFLKALLPDPGDLGVHTQGKTCIGNIIRGEKDGQEHAIYIYNTCDHGQCFEEVGSQGVSYTTGVPAMIGAKLLMEGKWFQPGVFNVEEFDPDPFMDDLSEYGLPWKLTQELPWN